MRLLKNMNVRHTNKSCSHGDQVLRCMPRVWLFTSSTSRRAVSCHFTSDFSITVFLFLLLFFSIKMYLRILITEVFSPPQSTDLKPLFYAPIIPSTFNNQRKGLTFYSFNASIRCRVVCLCEWLAPDLWLTCSHDSGSRECQSWWASRARTWDGQRLSLSLALSSQAHPIHHCVWKSHCK